MAERVYDDNSIKFLSVTEQMRQRPSMWGFNTSSIEGLQIQIKEIIDNAADEALDRNKIYPVNVAFFVSKDKKTYQCLVQDHGSGIPVGLIDRVFVGGFSSGKYYGEYGTTTGSNGIGSKAVSVFSKLFLAFTKRFDGFGYVKIEQGVVKDQYKQRKPVDKDDSTDGTTVLFQPDPTSFACLENMFGDPPTGEQENGFATFLKRAVNYPLFRSNLTLTVRVVDGLLKPADFNKPPIELWKFLTNPDNFNSKIVFQSDPGLTPRKYVTKTFGLKDPVWELGRITKTSSGKDDPLSYDIDVFLDERSLAGNNGLVAAVNYTPIIHPESSHIATFQSVIKDLLVDNIADNEAKAYFEAKYRIPFSGGISAGWVNAAFIGQDKTRFEDRRFMDAYRTSLRKQLRAITETKGEGFWDGLWEIIKTNFEQEYAKFMHKSFRSTASIKNLCFSLRRPDSFKNCKLTNNQITELFITEGDSAAGGVTKVRDSNTQALLSFSGKPINAIRSEGKKLNANAIYQDLIAILGVNPGDRNLDNMRFNKILIMTDADADGYHIVALTIGILYKINPLILEEGRVYVTNPPLYALANKQGTVFLRDEAALRDTRINSYRILLDIDLSLCGSKSVINLNKNRAQFRDICMVVTYVTDVLKHQADLLNINYLVLEQLLHVVDYLDEKNVNVAKIEKILGLDSAVWDKENNVLVLIDHGMEWRVPLNNLQTSLRAYVLPLYKRFNWNKYELFVSTKYSDLYRSQPCTFAMLAQIFDDIDKIYKVSRFKGLGEMSNDALRMTCVDKMTRCFTVVKGVGDVDRIYKMLDVDTEARKKLIQSNFIEEG